MILSDFAPVLDSPETKKVEKVWGQEYWLCNTSNYGCKLLSLKKDFQCSLHFHNKKSETFIVLSGFVKLELPDADVILQPGDRRNVNAGAEHRFTGITDALILEVSTKHEDSDSYRLENSRKI